MDPAMPAIVPAWLWGTAFLWTNSESTPLPLSCFLSSICSKLWRETNAPMVVVQMWTIHPALWSKYFTYIVFPAGPGVGPKVPATQGLRFKNLQWGLAVVVHALNPNTQEVRQAALCRARGHTGLHKFQASPHDGYIVRPCQRERKEKLWCDGKFSG